MQRIFPTSDSRKIPKYFLYNIIVVLCFLAPWTFLYSCFHFELDSRFKIQEWRCARRLFLKLLSNVIFDVFQLWSLNE